MIEVQHLSKRHGAVLVVDDLTFRVPPGRVTGFVGPNGAGKSTTMRVTLGLETPSAGRVTICGNAYRDLISPQRVVGALLDTSPYHPGRSARSHLTFLCDSSALPRQRVSEVLELSGLGCVADRRVGSFSMGMRQRLGIAAALLGDPQVLVLDEPTNGLDPEGIVWLRGLLKSFADDGRTVLISSHVMTEMALIAEHLVLVAHGRLLADLPVPELIAAASGPGRPRLTLEDAYLILVRGSESGSSLPQGES